jgi:ribosomal protein S19E (S16A)
MLFIENKYTHWYYSIIANAHQQNRKKLKRTHPNYIPYERHHIVPKCFFIDYKRNKSTGWLTGNSEDPANKVYLTVREHFICHWMLTKMITGIGRTKMIYALHKMYSANIHHTRYLSKITSRVFEKLKLEHATCISKMNTGRRLTDEHKEQIRLSMIGKNKGKLSLKKGKSTGKPSPLKGIPFSDEHCQNLSISAKGKPKSESHCKNMSVARKGKPWSAARRLAQPSRIE